jgi:hypothetical protein
MGFVDFTPKKESIIEKSIGQYDLYFSNKNATISFLEKYHTTSDGEVELFQQMYPPDFKIALEGIVNSVDTIVLNTPVLVTEFTCERNRPISFHDAISTGNNYNRSLKICGEVIDFDPFDITQTYDGVHYTDKGNEFIFNRVKPYL